MFKHALPLAVLVSLVACQTGPVSVLYKEGSTRTERQEAYDQCFIAALKDVPQNMVTEVTGGYSYPGYVSCNSDGDTTVCGEVGGYTTPVESYSYDTNEKLRKRLINRCLSDKGFSGVEIPYCQTKEERAAYQMQTTQPPLSELTCVTGPTVSSQ
ncbi:hypothetical protein [Martelella soudanensis]|uniref:hypothetical protein n=1 Tax=unclassified Martelella TaxID=2629616 RepID=UPI0015DFE577|nr:MULTISPECIES: hypothetical protein [unclassified Martelella]